MRSLNHTLQCMHCTKEYSCDAPIFKLVILRIPVQYLKQVTVCYKTAWRRYDPHSLSHLHTQRGKKTWRTKETRYKAEKVVFIHSVNSTKKKCMLDWHYRLHEHRFTVARFLLQILRLRYFRFALFLLIYIPDKWEIQNISRRFVS
jgi:hypothetical protein